MAIREIKAEVPASVWEVRVSSDDYVHESQELMILESMKMEIPVHAPVAGRVVDVTCVVGQSVQVGDVLLTIEIE